ncbi:MAG: hypothetical protein AB1735_08265 [Pseudomonadota bacterium]
MMQGLPIFTMTGIIVSLYLVLGAIIVAVEWQRVRAGRPFDALSLFNGAYFLFFVFAPINVLVLGEDAVRQKYAYQNWSHGDVWTAGALMLSYLLFVMGYHRKRKKPLIPIEVGTNAVRVALWLIGGYVLVGAAALIYHVSLVGGVLETLQFAPGTRTGQFELDGDFLFVRQFSFFLATAFMLAWAVYIERNACFTSADGSGVSWRPWLWVLLVLTGLAFAYYALSTYGRREFLYPFIICLMVWALAGRQRLWAGLGWLVTLAALWFVVHSVVIPSSLLSSFTQPAAAQPAAAQPAAAQPAAAQPAAAQPAAAQLVSVDVYELYLKTVQGLNDSFIHFVAAEHAELWQFGFLTDIRELPLQFLPSQVLGFDRPPGMLGETSEFILGRPLEPGLSGEEPLGLHGYLLVNFSYAGMFLVFFLLGMGYRVIDSVLRPAQGGAALGWLMFLWVVVGALEFLREGVLIFVLKPRFSWWLAIGILLWFACQRQTGPHTAGLESIPQRGLSS